MARTLITQNGIEDLKLHQEGGLHWTGKIVLDFTSSDICPLDRSDMIKAIFEQINKFPNSITLDV